MKLSTAFLLFGLSMCMAISAIAQPYNANPDPNGEPWWIGGLPELTPEIQAELDAIPELVLSPASLQTVLPDSVDNSKWVWFRPIFQQKDNSCAHASGIGYTFTYEVNRVRNLPSNNAQNQYPTHYTWNYSNGGGNNGSFYQNAWNVIKDSGIPNVPTYGGIWLYDAYADSLKRWTVWMNGYDKYHSALHNRVLDSTISIGVSTPVGLEKLKHWLNDHGEGAETGGLVVFSAYAHGDGLDFQELPPESDETGKKIVTRWGSTGYHAMTIVGYNDSIKFDFDSSGTFTNPEGNMAQWEIGALKVANSAGPGWQDDGFVYMPYRLLALHYSLGGITPNTVYGIKVRETHTPRVTLRLKVAYPIRRYISFRGGVADDPNATSPTRTQTYQAYGRLTPELLGGGGNFPMQGINTDPIEIELDVTSLLDGIMPAKFFLEVDNRVTSGHIDTVLSLNGFVHELTLVDYDTHNGIPVEVNYTSSSFPVPIVKNGITTLSIEYDYIPSTITSDLSIDRDIWLRKIVSIVEGGALHLEPSSRLTIAEGAKLYIRPNSALQVDACAELEVLPGGEIIVETAGTLQLSHNAILNVHDGQAAFSINNAAIIPLGFVNPSEDIPPTYRIVDGSHVWSSVGFTMHRELVVETGAKLTLENPSLKFRRAGIRVKYGAEMTVNGGTLTAFESCGSGRWPGVIVEGRYDRPQIPTQQGYLYLNGAMVESAITGIKVKGGGVIGVTSSTFIDNHHSIVFEPYRNGSESNKSYISHSNFFASYRARLLILNGVAAIGLTNNTFVNTNPGDEILQRGYGVYAENADVNLIPRNSSNTFTNLFTAVHAVSTGGVNSFTVEDAVIEGCFNGIHVSGYPAPVVENCSIQLPYEVYQDRVPTGISIAAMDGLSIIGNTITSNASPGSGVGYGIHLESYGRSSGLIWGNAIGAVDVGIMAIGPVDPIQIPALGSTVQLQCNQLYGNRTADIYVDGDGIASEQGDKDISASNQFEAGPLYNIFSRSMPITYYAYPHPYYPQKVNEHVKVMEAMILADCGDGFGTLKPLLEDITHQDDSLAQARQMLIALQDLGETDALVETVEDETNPIRLRNALLRRSPLLSDTVMVTTSHDQVPLPNLMLAQVLMGNPQAAKSAAVLQALDERENTLPDYLLDAIHEAGSDFSPIDGAKAEVARHRATRDILAGRLLARLAGDTLAKRYDSIGMLRDYHPDRIYRYLAAFALSEQGQVEEALIALQSMAGEPGLTPEQLQETAGVTQLVNVLAELEQAGIPLEHMDSLTRSTLEGLTTNGVGLAALLAGNALAVADTIPFLAQELAVGEAYSGTHAG